MMDAVCDGGAARGPTAHTAVSIVRMTPMVWPDVTSVTHRGRFLILSSSLLCANFKLYIHTLLLTYCQTILF